MTFSGNTQASTLLLAVILATGCSSRNQRPPDLTGDTTANELVRTLLSLPPWPTVAQEFRSGDLEQYANAAYLFQQAEPADVRQALSAHNAGPRKYYDNSHTVPFLLLRLMFDLPSAAPLSVRHYFIGLTNWPEPVDGVVDLSWPFKWFEQGPRLVAGFRGASGPPYSPSREYDYFLKLYRFRELAQLVK